MIIENNSPYGVGDVVAIKLANGEEILGKLKKIDLGAFIVEKPATILVNSAQGDQIAMDLQPSMISMDINKVVEVQKTGVLMMTQARKELADAYTAKTSGIVPANAGALNALDNTAR